MKLAILVSVLGLAACGPKKVSEGAVRCEQIAGGVWDRIAAARRTADPSDAMSADSLAVLKRVSITSCKNDGWSDKLLGCVQASGDEDALFACLKSGLTPDQSDALIHAFDQAFAKMLIEKDPGTAPVRFGN